jgi:predicted Zn-dependent protease
MPELFNRMGESFARNPALGFPNFLNELSQMESPALQGVRVSIGEERQAGERARSEYLRNADARGYRVVTDRVRLDYVRALVERFAARMTNRDRYPKIDVSLINAPVSDGQSFPGGFLVFTTALLDEPDEATVAGVVAHELAHLDRGHLYGYVRRSKLAENAFDPSATSGMTFDQFFTRQAAVFGMMMNPFRPEHENEADCTAATWMFQEGYDPRALVRFFERMHERKNDQPDNPFFSFGRTHPFSLDRRDHVLARLAQLKRWRPKQELGLYAENLKKFEPRKKEPDQKN